jgi:hypothetical protein
MAVVDHALNHFMGSAQCEIETDLHIKRPVAARKISDGHPRASRGWPWKLRREGRALAAVAEGAFAAENIERPTIGDLDSHLSSPSNAWFRNQTGQTPRISAVCHWIRRFGEGKADRRKTIFQRVT